MPSKAWKAVENIENAKYLGIIELEKSENHFEVVHVENEKENKLVFGGYCNVGLLQSGFLEIEDGESVDEALQELLTDLEVYYSDGLQYVSRIVCNDRM